MFSVHSRGDIIQYLQSEGFRPSSEENTDDLRAAANLHAQVVAMQRSPTFREAMQNAGRVLRKVEHQHAPTVEHDCEDDEAREPYYGYDELF